MSLHYSLNAILNVKPSRILVQNIIQEAMNAGCCFFLQDESFTSLSHGEVVEKILFSWDHMPPEDRHVYVKHVDTYFELFISREKDDMVSIGMGFSSGDYPDRKEFINGVVEMNLARYARLLLELIDKYPIHSFETQILD